MGIPSLFSFLSRKYDDIIISLDETILIDNFYIDLNCLIHPQCRIVTDKFSNSTDIEQLEYNMFKQIIIYLNYIISYVNPSKLVYISIDGPAPFAKMTQQRRRRYKSIKEKIYKKDLIQKYQNKDTNVWDTNAITPGTEFMAKLSTYISNYLKSSDLCKKIKVHFSSWTVPGEGEHKILDHIRHNQNDNISYCIYGLDADLIMLSLASQVENIYLLREINTVKITEDSQLQYVSIKILKHHIEDYIYEKVNYNYNTINIINDFILYCCLLGNDFIPSIPSLRVHDNGVIKLVHIYSDILENYKNCLIKNNNIDNHFLCLIMHELSNVEIEWLKKLNNNSYIPPFDGDGIIEKEMYNYHNLLPKNDDIIMLGSLNYKERYYKEYFNMTDLYNNNNELSISLKNICKNYLHTLKWIIKYYLEGCIDWKWDYGYTHAPFASDLYKYMIEVKDDFDINDLSIFKLDSTPFLPLEQLLIVLPPQSNQLLPEKYRSLVENENSAIIDIYPIDFEQDIYNKRFEWQCIPYLPQMETERILEESNKIKLSNEETERNTLEKDYIY